MPSDSQLYEAFSEKVSDNPEYDPDHAETSLDHLSDMEKDELWDILTDEEFVYDEFADWCIEHNVKYH